MYFHRVWLFNGSVLRSPNETANPVRCPCKKSPNCWSWFMTVWLVLRFGRHSSRVRSFLLRHFVYTWREGRECVSSQTCWAVTTKWRQTAEVPFIISYCTDNLHWISNIISIIMPSFMLHCIISYHILSYHIIYIYYIISYYIRLYCMILCSIILYYTVLHSIVWCYIIP